MCQILIDVYLNIQSFVINLKIIPLYSQIISYVGIINVIIISFILDKIIY